MKKIRTAILVSIAAATMLIVGTGTSSAATVTADLFAYKLPPTATAPCRIGITNFGPDTVNVELGPSNTFEKVYYKLVGDVAPGKSTVAEYGVKCEALESDKVLLIGAFGFAPGTSDSASDPNQLNNFVAYAYKPATTFGSS